MKKFNLKTLLILILALVLCFALVACNNDGDKDNGDDSGDGVGGGQGPEPILAKDYFDKLWALSSNIGSEAINATEDKFALSADLGVSVMKMTGNMVTDSFDVGIALKAVIDQANAQQDTAIQLNLYDPSTDEDWATLAYFLGDANNVYVDFGGQQFKVGFSVGKDGQGNSYNSTWAGVIDSLINDQVLVKNEGGNAFGANGTIADVLSAITSGMGNNWTLDTLVNGLLDFFKLDLSQYLDPTTEIGGLINQLIPGIIDEDGNVSIQKVATSDLFGQIATGASVNENNGQNDYKLSLDLSKVKVLLSSMLDGVYSGLSTLLDSKFELAFTEKDNAIENFELTAVFDSLLDQATSVKPAVKLAINELEFTKLGATTAESNFGMTKANYADSFNLNASVSVDVEGVKVNPGVLDPTGTNTALQALNGATLDGTYTLAVAGNVDLLNEGAQNKTQAYLYLSKTNEQNVAEKILEVSYTGSTKQLGVKVNQAVTIPCTSGNVSIAQTVVALAGKPLYNWLTEVKSTPTEEDPTKTTGPLVAPEILDPIYAAITGLEVSEVASAPAYTLDENFKGAVVGNVDVVALFQGAIKKLGDKINEKLNTIPNVEAQTSAESTEVYPISAINVFEIIKLAPKYISGTNGLGISASNLSQEAVKFIASNGNALTADDLYGYIIARDSEWASKFAPYIPSLTIPANLEDTDTTNDVARVKKYNELTQAECTEMWQYAIGKKEYTGTAAGFEDMIATLLPNIVNHLVNLEDATDVLTAVFDGSLSVVLDASEDDGLTITVDLVAVGGASVGITINLDADEYKAEDFVAITMPTDDTTGWLAI